MMLSTNLLTYYLCCTVAIQQPLSQLSCTLCVAIDIFDLYLECSGWGGGNGRAGGPLPSPLLFLSLPFLRSRSPTIQLGGLGIAVSSPSGV